MKIKYLDKMILGSAKEPKTVIYERLQSKKEKYECKYEKEDKANKIIFIEDKGQLVCWIEMENQTLEDVKVKIKWGDNQKIADKCFIYLDEIVKFNKGIDVKIYLNNKLIWDETIVSVPK